MKSLAQIHDAKDAKTTKASEVSRQLAFAGFAVLWTLKPATAGLPAALAPAAAAFAAALFLDAIQYISASLAYVVLYNVEWEKHKDDKALIDIPPIANWVPYGCFWAKVVLVALGWSLLVDQLVTAWKWTSVIG